MFPLCFTESQTSVTDLLTQHDGYLWSDCKAFPVGGHAITCRDRSSFIISMAI